MIDIELPLSFTFSCCVSTSDIAVFVMDLGYSSSDSESAVEAERKRHYDSEEIEEIDVVNIFGFTGKDNISGKVIVDEKQGVKRQKIRDDERISSIISSVLADTIEKEGNTAGDDENEDDTENSDDNDDDGGIPEGAEVKELDMNEFYRKNQDAIDAGELDGSRQGNIGKVVYHHQGGSSNIGRLDGVIRFNLSHEDKIMFQNKEKIRKEKALAVERNR